MSSGRSRHRCVAFLGRFHKFFLYNPQHLDEIGFVALGYAALEATEMVGLWFIKRWAEYLTFVATALLPAARGLRAHVEGQHP